MSRLKLISTIRNHCYITNTDRKFLYNGSLERRPVNMDLLKKMGRRLGSFLPGNASRLDGSGEAMYNERYSVHCSF